MFSDSERLQCPSCIRSAFYSNLNCLIFSPLFATNRKDPPSFLFPLAPATLPDYPVAMDSNDLDLNDIVSHHPCARYQRFADRSSQSLLSSDPATLSLLERAISRRHAAAQLELGWLNDCLHSRLGSRPITPYRRWRLLIFIPATIRDASEFSAPFPEINTQSEVPEVIKQINEMMASLREKVPDQSAGAVLVSNRVAVIVSRVLTDLCSCFPLIEGAGQSQDHP